MFSLSFLQNIAAELTQLDECLSVLLSCLFGGFHFLSLSGSSIGERSWRQDYCELPSRKLLCTMIEWGASECTVLFVIKFGKGDKCCSNWLPRANMCLIIGSRSKMMKLSDYLSQNLRTFLDKTMSASRKDILNLVLLLSSVIGSSQFMIIGGMFFHWSLKRKSICY